MREIKFRAWDDEHEQWVYGWYTKLTEGIRRFDAIISDVNGELIRFYIHDLKTIGEYTGLHDVNGKEIYEGDIARIIYIDYPGSTSEVRHPPIISDVAYHDFTASFSFGECKDGDATHFNHRHMEIEVIGNIHEHGNLLEAKA